MPRQFPFPWQSFQQYETAAEMQAALDADTFVELDTPEDVRDFEAVLWRARYQQLLAMRQAEDARRPPKRRHGYAPGKPLEYRNGRLVWGTWKTLEAKPHSDGLGGGIVRLRRSTAFQVVDQAAIDALRAADAAGRVPAVPAGLQPGDWVVRTSNRYEGLLDALVGDTVSVPEAADLAAEADDRVRQLLVAGAEIGGRTLARTRSATPGAFVRKTRSELSARGLASVTFHYEGQTPVVMENAPAGGGAVVTILVALASAATASAATWYAMGVG